jgi:cytochrome c-type biogenesis protein CcmH/NrfF
LWIAPLVLLLAGGFVLVNILRRRMAMPMEGDAAAEE